jgi:signal transduction histidine kinase
MGQPGSPGAILVVDDTEANRYTIARILKKVGFEVQEAADGRSGLEMATPELDLIILDIRMPEMDGYEVCRRLKADPLTRPIPILHISATYTSVSDIAFGLEGGADGYLTHPVDPDVLLATVRAFLRLRRADRALRLSEAEARARAEELQAVMYAVPAAVMIAHDPQAGSITGNAAAHDLLRVPIGAALSIPVPGRGWTSHFRVFRGTTELTRQELPIQRAALSGAPVPAEELEIVFGDGSSKYIYGSAAPLFDENGAVRGAVGSFIDITERRQAQAQLERAQRMESIGRLAGGIAHETNNQMAVVLGFAEYVLHGTNLTPEQKRDLMQVKGGAERVAQLTRQLLALSRRQTLYPEILNLDALIRESHSVISRLLGPESSIVLDLDAAPKWVRADRTQIVQVLLNLSLNARDAMPNGGRVTISTRRVEEVPPGGRLGRHWARLEGAALLSVMDTGTGIDPSVSARIFEPFFTTKPIGQGTGLGLSVVEGIIEQSSGEVWVTSQAGKGTTFTLALPLVEASASSGETAAPNAAGGPETLLVVEDEETVRGVLVRGLVDKGYRVLQACDSSEALEIISRMTDDIDLVITDVAMPGVSGIELARRAQELRPNLPFVLVSGQPREGLSDFSDLGPQNVLLEKPFLPEVLAAAVRLRLDHREIRGRSEVGSPN